ncbi:hypothetical protein QBC46DRAFT_421103 [Diplogelasinospora grovesii]|uniref:CFEM domain-containing protein n=1 Tax=Diplogelasinospora grovesii TaxID=303347 RepID=A0AAN6N028_9PEZI|nr:hypothetical protein QBC46DRAFT_421103 [Diplogelasinospora grovesii]
MKYFTVLTTLLAAAMAQDISIIPACAQPCIIAAVGNATTCQVTDFKCICANKAALITAATPCVLDKCGLDVATGQVLPATDKFCSEVAAGGSGSSASSTSTTSSASAVSTSTAVVVPTSSASASSASSASSAVSSTATATATSTATASASSSSVASTTVTGVVVVPSGTGSSSSSTRTASTATSVVTAGAAHVGASVGGLAMLILGAAAAL